MYLAMYLCGLTVKTLSSDLWRSDVSDVFLYCVMEEKDTALSFLIAKSILVL